MHRGLCVPLGVDVVALLSHCSRNKQLREVLSSWRIDEESEAEAVGQSAHPAAVSSTASRGAAPDEATSATAADHMDDIEMLVR